MTVGVQYCGSLRVFRILCDDVTLSSNLTPKCTSLETITTRDLERCSRAALLKFGSKSVDSRAVDRWLTCRLSSKEGR